MFFIMSFFLRALLAVFLIVPPLAAQQAELLQVDCVWKKAPHNAFTDLIRFKGRWFLAFREGAGHVSPEASIRILTSLDARTWRSATLISEKGVDLRDPKLSVTPDGRLLLVCGRRTWPPRFPRTLRSCVAFSKDGFSWSEPKTVLGENQWLWRVTWHGKTAWGVAYGQLPGKKRDYASQLYRSADGVSWRPVHRFSGWPGLTEATIRFGGDDRMYLFHRRDAGTRTALLGTSKPPYTEWNLHDTGAYWGGPNMIFHQGRWYASGRRLEGGAKTVLGLIDWKAGKIRSLLTLPSGGDTSYPGMVSCRGELYLSYYSSHEGKTSIYLARIRIKPSK